MGLKKAIGDRFGNANPNAHIAVEQIAIFPISSEATIVAAIWKDKAAKSTDSPFEQEPFTAKGTDFDDYFSDNELKKAGNSPEKNAETYLKTLAKFSGAIDD